MIALYIIIALIIIIAIWAITAYNGLVRLRNKADEAEAGVDAHLKQRYDLVPNLVETVKGYASHEKSTLDAVIEARNRTVSVKSLQERAKLVISVAHPEHREMLDRAAFERFGPHYYHF